MFHDETKVQLNFYALRNQTGNNDNSFNPIGARLFYVECQGRGRQNLPPLNFSPKTLTIEIKLFMMLDILMKNLSVEKNWKKVPQFLLLSGFLFEHLWKNL